MQFFNIFFPFVVAVCFRVKITQTALFFPSNSAYGIFAAIAVPLDLPNRDVFVSYNFEANYNLPKTWNLPPYALGVEDEDLFGDAARFNNDQDCTNCTASSSSIKRTVENVTKHGNNTTKASLKNQTDTRGQKEEGRKRREIPSLLTRTHFYHILIDKFKRSGFEGESCLLRLICETNASELGQINGVLGNLIQIMFAPTTSKNENLPLTYYQAEIDGIQNQCHHYEEECSESILDLISTPIHEFMDQMREDLNKVGK